MMQNTLTSGDFAVSFIPTHGLDAGKLKCHTCDWEIPCDEIITSRLKLKNITMAFEEEMQDHIYLHWAIKTREEIQAIEKELG
jgi:hypothetical protein